MVDIRTATTEAPKRLQKGQLSLPSAPLKQVLVLAVLLLLSSLHTSRAYCARSCSGHGYCGEYDKCHCVMGADGQEAFTGADCSQRTCPKGDAWVGAVAGANNVHPAVECSAKGTCDRETGTCLCFDNYEGLACERTVCPQDCSGHGECYTAKQLADDAGATYSTPWDADKHVGCVCDAGYRGFMCHHIECPSGPDTLKGLGNEAGRDCSGRGICDYGKGRCRCVYVCIYMPPSLCLSLSLL